MPSYPADLVTIDAPSAIDATLRVHRVDLKAKMSSPGRLELTATTGRIHEADVLDELLGEQVVVRFHALRGGERHVVGDVTRATALDEIIDGRSALQLRIETPDWRLRRRVNSRVFQEISTPDILAVVLGEHAIDHVFQLRESYPVREYCVQYQESDVAFVERLLGDAGLFYFHTSPEDAVMTRLVIADSSSLYVGHAAPLVLHPRVAADGSALDAGMGDALFELRAHKSTRPQGVVARRYDETRPQSSFESIARAPTLARSVVERRGLESVATGSALPQPEVEPSTLYLHRARALSLDDRAHDAGTLLEQHRRDVLVVAGRSNADDMAPGRVVRVGDHPIAVLNDDYVVTSVEHTYELGGGADTVYSNRFECVPSTVAYRSPPAEPRRINAVETATVMGPAGTRVHTDQLGRVKVRFHWERSTRDSHHSCWVRAIQPWAGGGWGAVFLPRVGTEVAIGFLGGDVDRPVILGGLYNGSSFPPVDLPREALRSGFRSASVDPTTGNLAGGSSHILFSDEVEHEVVSLRAQRDYHEEIFGTSTSTVGGDRAVDVQGLDKLNVASDREVFVNGSAIESTTKSRIERVGGTSELHVAGGRMETIGGTVFRQAAGITDVSATHHNLSVGRELSISVGGLEGDANAMLSVDGRLASFASTSIHQTSEHEIALNVGESSILITPDRIRLVAKEIEVGATRSSRFRGGGAGVALAGGVDISAGEVRIASPGASLVLDANASLDGALVRLNCGGASAGVAGISGDEVDLRPLRLQLLKPSGIPMSGWSYLIVSEGVREEGSADALGIVATKVPPSATTATLHVRNPVDDDDKFTWNIKLGPLPPITTTEGVRVRLQNLGFYRGAPSGETIEGDDPRLTEALTSFQRAHDLEPTGEIDGPTVMALQAIEG